MRVFIKFNHTFSKFDLLLSNIKCDSEFLKLNILFRSNLDLNDEIFSEEDGDFNLLQYSRSKRQHTIYLPALSKILFATAKYPDLSDTQAFTPIALVVKKDSVDIIGHLIEMVKED